MGSRGGGGIRESRGGKEAVGDEGDEGDRASLLNPIDQKRHNDKKVLLAGNL